MDSFTYGNLIKDENYLPAENASAGKYTTIGKYINDDKANRNDDIFLNLPSNLSPKYSYVLVTCKL